MPPLVVQQLMVVEREFLELGPSAEAFRRAAAAAGTSKLAGELADIVDPERSLGREAPVAALARTLEFQRFRAQEFRSTVAANGVAPTPTPAGRRLELMLARIRESRPRSARRPRSPSSSVGL